MKCFFVDTNLFLQCRPLNELPWGDVSDGEDVRLVVPRTAQVEIDNFKSDGKGRRSQRARTVSATFRDIIRSPDLELVVRAANPRVTMTLAVPQRSEKSQEETGLDPARPDNAILLQLLSYLTNRLNDEHVAVLTQDVNLLLSARTAGIPFTEIPDAWLMPPEPDERDKKIKALEEELKLRSLAAPVIAIEGGNAGASPLTISLKRYKPLTEQELLHLLFLAESAFPKERKPVSFGPGRVALPTLKSLQTGLLPPLPEDISRYQDVVYPEWLARMKEGLMELAHRLNEETVSLTHEFTISNTGSVPAEHVVVRIAAPQGFLITDVPKSTDEDPMRRALSLLPVPPARPASRLFGPYARALGRIDATRDLLSPIVDSIALSSRRDRNRFYRKTSRSTEGDMVKELECDEFRHQVEAKSFGFALTVADLDMPPTGGTVTFEVSARNLVRPAKAHATLRVETVDASTAGEAQRLIYLLCRHAERHASP
ncbi:UNVERIFIED_ORG: hypothetical protein J2W38_006759 [Variovorax paradoxus]|nr:hypothetical protein [Variovorax paradoxus]